MSPPHRGAGGVAAGSPWAGILVVYAAGVYAAAQLGKLAALAPLMAPALGLSLVTMALATSLIEIGGAVLGIAAGSVAARLGLRGTLLGAIGCLIVGSAGAATAQGAATLIAWRLIEAAGYLGVIVSAPVLIAQAAGPRLQGTALALWSSFVPVGLALGAWGHAAVAAQGSWRVAMLASAVVGAGLLMVLWRSPSAAARGLAPGSHAPLPEASHHEAAPASPGALGVRPAAWFLSASFGAWTFYQVGLLALLPSLLTASGHMTTTTAAGWTGAASMAALIGSATAAWLLKRDRPLGGVLAATLVGPALLAFAVFTPAGATSAAPWAAVVLTAVSGVFGSLAFALVPRAAGGAHRMAQANGLIAQFGASGSLLGPPVMAAAVEHAGWGAAAVCGLVVSLIAVPLALRALGSAR